MFVVEYTSRIKVIQLSNMGQEWFLTHMPENSPFARPLIAIPVER